MRVRSSGRATRSNEWTSSLCPVMRLMLPRGTGLHGQPRLTCTRIPSNADRSPYDICQGFAAKAGNAIGWSLVVAIVAAG